MQLFGQPEDICTYLHALLPSEPKHNCVSHDIE
jgi:hypothetical protein